VRPNGIKLEIEKIIEAATTGWLNATWGFEIDNEVPPVNTEKTDAINFLANKMGKK
jgi:hypothetical protein